MPHLFPVAAKRLQKYLSKNGFVAVRQKGSHQLWRHADGRTTVVPVHPGEDIGRGLLRSILNDLEISVESFINEI